jgi:hypothetical protein
MRLLIVSTWLPFPPDNGSRMRALAIVRRLAQRHELTVLTFGPVPEGIDMSPFQDVCRQLTVVPREGDATPRLRLRGLLSIEPRHYIQTWNAAMHAVVSAEVCRHDAAIALQGDAARYLDQVAALPRVFDEVEVGLFRQAYVAAPDIRRRLRAGLTWWKFAAFIRRMVERLAATCVESPSFPTVSTHRHVASQPPGFDVLSTPAQSPIRQTSRPCAISFSGYGR